MRISSMLLVLIPVFVTALCGQAPQPHAGWKLVPGGENLIATGYWDTFEEGSAPVVMQVSNGVLTGTAVNGYLGNPNPAAPRLYTKGDFGVVATIQTAPGMNGAITLTGSMNTGTQFWQGLTQVEFGADSSGNYVFYYWDGTQATPVVYKVLKAFGTPPTGTLTIELLRRQGQFFVYFNGAEYGPFADPGLFALGYVFPGFQAFPNQQIQLTQLAFEVPADDTSAQLQTPVGAIPYSHPGDSLGSLAAATGRTFGTQVSAEELATGRYTWWTPGVTGGAPDPTYGPKVIGEFNSIAASEMYFFMTETGQGDFTFGNGDAILADTRANGLTAHCHNLIGGNIYLPSWVVNGNFTADQLTQIMKTHIQTVMGHFKGQCSSWDVVNEALKLDGTVDTSSNNVWGKTIGPSYIDIAFQTARQVDPGTKLYYNDWYVENQTPKTTGLYNLVAGMQQRGIPIDGVGLQCHWLPGNPDPKWVPIHDSLVANMAQLATMGLSVRLSELDARLPLPPSAADLATQATIFSTTVQACLDSPNCVSVVVYGPDDNTSWIDSTYPGYGAATLFDANFQPKPAYTAVMNTLRSAATAAESSGWNLVWSDEFNGASGTAPNPANWNYDLGGGGCGNGEIESYTNSPNNVFQDGNGNLVIRAIKDAQGHYTSARLQSGSPRASTSTADNHWQYGRIEARIKLPFGKGVWPAFWMLGEDYATAGWPGSGEVDIMENYGTWNNNASINNGTPHGPGYSNDAALSAQSTLPFGETVYDDYHVYAVEWLPNSIVWYVDGAAYNTLTWASMPAGGQWVFDAPFFLLLNLAIGGPSTFLGTPDATVTFPQDMLVDYVRVYQPTTVPATTPVITPGRIVNAASYVGAISPGSLAVVYGNNLADGQHLIPTPGTGESFPTTVAGVTVSVHGVNAALVYVSPTQINFQVPWETAPALAVPVKVTRNSVDSNIEQVTIASTASPSFFLSEFVNGVAWVTGNVADGCPTPLSECSVKAGSIYQLWANGLGPKTSPLQDGVPAPPAALQVPGGPASCQLTIGAQPATVVYCGVAPDEIIDQVNFTYPAGVSTTLPYVGATLTINGATGHFRVPAPAAN